MKHGTLIKRNISLAKFTTFKIGGGAKYFCEVKAIGELREALDFAKKKCLKIFILGGGSNLLVSDQGFSGLVIKIVNCQLSIVNCNIEAESGVPLGKVVIESIGRGLAGLEWAAGIPGTLGGAVRGNAGAFGGSMQDTVESVTAFNIKSGRVQKFKNKDCAFVYRGSIFKKNLNLVVWSVKLSLKNGNKEELKNFIKEKTIYRVTRHPIDHPSAGSVFKNIHNKDTIDKFLKKFSDVKKSVEKWGNKIPAAYLIDECGLKGRQVGGAMVSPKHPNFIVNFKNARAEDVIILMGIIKQKVRNKFGILLEEEVQLVGF